MSQISTFVLTKENLRQKNFTPEEFLHSDTAIKLGINNEPDLCQLTAGMSIAKKMQELRDAIDKPFTITSGFRCEALNKAVGGAPDSWHMQFLACDFNIQGMTPPEAVSAIKDSKVSIDKCFIERECVHIQTNIDDSKNRNFFASVAKIDGVWKIIENLK
jgi:zinc D-Ala-D-Ala carboxypeptidase